MSKVIPTLALVLFAAACSEPTAFSTANNPLRISAATVTSASNNADIAARYVVRSGLGRLRELRNRAWQLGSGQAQNLARHISEGADNLSRQIYRPNSVAVAAGRHVVGDDLVRPLHNRQLGWTRNTELRLRQMADRNYGTVP
jgi:hypothetical protein